MPVTPMRIVLPERLILSPGLYSVNLSWTDFLMIPGSLQPKPRPSSCSYPACIVPDAMDMNHGAWPRMRKAAETCCIIISCNTIIYPGDISLQSPCGPLPGNPDYLPGYFSAGNAASGFISIAYALALGWQGKVSDTGKHIADPS